MKNRIRKEESGSGNRADDSCQRTGAESTASKTVNLRLRKVVFFPPWLFLMCLVIISLVNSDAFVAGLDIVTDWILNNFAWAFDLTTLGCVFGVLLAFISPLGKVRIGGSKAHPKMTFIDLVWITLCTTIAAGILLWASAEPLYHLYSPAASAEVESGSAGAAIFAMETMYLEWTWSPYAIDTVGALLFAFVFYNMHQRFSIGSMFVPLFGEKVRKYDNVIDLICLFSLVLGMSSCLGMGTLTIAGGIENLFGVESGPTLWFFVIVVVVITFIISSVSGVFRGIRMLSRVNARIYIILLAFLFILGPTTFILNFSTESLGEFARDFLQMSLMTGEAYGDSWAKSWPCFYWCNWLAWAPVIGVFLGKILYGYTIRDAIICNFFIPSIFVTIWMSVFSSSAIYYEWEGVGLYDLLLESGEGSVVYGVFDQLPLSLLLTVVYLFIVFISFVTSADSNTNVMAGLCTDGLTEDNQESKAWLKVLWGISVGAMTWILISFAGIDGIKAAANLGGFPNMFLMILMLIVLFKISWNPAKYDVHKEDYDSFGHPLPSKRLSVESPVKKDGKKKFGFRKKPPEEEPEAETVKSENS